MARALTDTRPVVVGSGLAGLTAALALAPTECILVTPGELTDGAASMWAQGGVAAAIAADDSPALHAIDTWKAGAFAGDRPAIDRITAAAPDVVRQLAALGVPFDRTAAGDFDLGLEGGHSRNRIAHVADRCGAAITATVAGAVRATTSIDVMSGWHAVRIVTDAGHVAGLVVADAAGVERVIDTGRVILATGGLGGLFGHTTNPRTALGQGVALAGRAGAELADLHLVQFHPTALDVGRDPMPLLTEALRGAGATLRADGARFTDELQPRDVVSAAVWRQFTSGHQVTLDARHVEGVHERFTAVDELCRHSGLDITADLLPVRPAVHYSMGGIVVDARSRTSVPGLWAVGECARTGLHGANRLASNSLLEAVVTAQAAALDSRKSANAPRGSANAPRKSPYSSRGSANARRGSANVPALPLQRVREILDANCGVLRDAAGIGQAIEQLAPFVDTDDAAYVAHLIATSALAHPHSIGAHRRTDDPPRQEATA